MNQYTCMSIIKKVGVPGLDLEKKNKLHFDWKGAAIFGHLPFTELNRLTILLTHEILRTIKVI